MVDPCMYLFVNRGLGMSPGKVAAQAAHAAVEAYRISDQESNVFRLWYRGGHYKKIVLLGRDEDHMRNIEAYLKAREIPCVTIIDEGHTEIASLSITAIGVPVLDKAHANNAAIFSTFDLYKDEPAVPAELTLWQKVEARFKD
jgi:PTH2 family peptidyl-tRNA hydrolase